MTRKLSVIVFPGGANLPLWAGMATGTFSKFDLDIEVRYTRSSVEQVTALANGECDLGLTGFDNIVAYREGQGEAELEKTPDLFAFMGGDDAFLRLVVQKEIQSYSDLRGKVLSVDALTTGFAFVLRKMLAANGIGEDEVTFERAGGVLQRFEGLKERRHAGTLLLTPFELSGRRFGLKVLQPASAVIPHYQGIVGVASDRWAHENAGVLEAFIAGYLMALRFLFAPENRATAIDILMQNVPGMPRELATGACDIFLAEPGGFDPLAAVDRDGIEAVLALRSEYGRPPKQLTDATKYFDLAYYTRARERVSK